MTIDTLLTASRTGVHTLQKAISDVPDADLRPLLAQAVMRLDGATQPDSLE